MIFIIFTESFWDGESPVQLGMINGIETRLSETVVSAMKDKKKDLHATHWPEDFNEFWAKFWGWFVFSPVQGEATKTWVGKSSQCNI